MTDSILLRVQQKTRFLNENMFNIDKELISSILRTLVNQRAQELTTNNLIS